MASSSGTLSEELQCSICLDVFIDPVTTPCGHNFCKNCLKQCWEKSKALNCPLCKESFGKRPNLKINTALRQVVQIFKEKSDVLCDICDEMKIKALKLYLVCQTSYCETHLEPHLRVPYLKKHKLTDLVKNLEDYIQLYSKRFISRLEALYCFAVDYESMGRIFMATRRLSSPLKCSGEHHSASPLDASLVNGLLLHPDSTQCFAFVIEMLWRWLFPKSWIIDKCLISAEETQQYAVDLTLDSDTASPYLILSGDGKQVRDGDINQKPSDNPKRFDTCLCVLAKEDYSSGRFYFEVQVKGKTEWDLGVARESVNRKGKITATPQNGYWSVALRNGSQYQASESSTLSLSVRVKPKVVGVFVDNEEGLVSFYDVESRFHIYSFTSQSFTEELYPYFSPGNSNKGKNATPLIITQVQAMTSDPKYEVHY
ncbi:nuclear factor 7, brain-like [Myxocyprinus asiaticus]|uniref:nuclear factor 7, brain-like n=1 Tax=Myxocyprinus asiaticus TaxID=70543 RepID=UPI002223C076|nr:nuclear factor 7, brain-like [Myxocyprinus asiaticus]